MGRAFLVKLVGRPGEPVAGRVRAVDTGEETVVRSADELLAVLVGPGAGPADRADARGAARPCPTDSQQVTTA